MRIGWCNWRSIMGSRRAETSSWHIKLMSLCYMHFLVCHAYNTHFFTKTFLLTDHVTRFCSAKVKNLRLTWHRLMSVLSQLRTCLSSSQAYKLRTWVRRLVIWIGLLNQSVVYRVRQIHRSCSLVLPVFHVCSSCPSDIFLNWSFCPIKKYHLVAVLLSYFIYLLDIGILMASPSSSSWPTRVKFFKLILWRFRCAHGPHIQWRCNMMIDPWKSRIVRLTRGHSSRRSPTSTWSATLPKHPTWSCIHYNRPANVHSGGFSNAPDSWSESI